MTFRRERAIKEYFGSLTSSLHQCNNLEETNQKLWVESGSWKGGGSQLRNLSRSLLSSANSRAGGTHRCIQEQVCTKQSEEPFVKGKTESSEEKMVGRVCSGNFGLRWSSLNSYVKKCRFFLQWLSRFKIIKPYWLSSKTVSFYLSFAMLQERQSLMSIWESKENYLSSWARGGLGAGLHQYQEPFSERETGKMICLLAYQNPLISSAKIRINECHGDESNSADDLNTVSLVPFLS